MKTLLNISPEKTENRTFSTRRLPTTLLALLLYTILTLCFFGKTGNWTNWYFGYASDPTAYVWFLDWWPFAIAHHLNPFITHYVWFPRGDNLTWHAAVPSAALLSLPVTLLGGPVVSFNLLSVLAPALSAWTAFLLARYLTRDWAAALVGGYLFGFSSYEFSQILGHLNLDLTFLVPLAVLICIKYARGELSPTRFVPALTVILLLQLGLSTEILATLCVLGAITWTIFLVCAREPDRPGLWRLAFGVLIAGTAMILLAMPFLFYLIKGLPDLPTEINPVAEFSADPLNYFIPTMVTRFGRTTFASLSLLFTGTAAEQGAYLGLPLLLLMAFYFRDQIARPYVKALFITAVILAILSLGPWLHVAHFQTHIPLPWWLGTKLPIIRSALPTRFTMYIALVSTIVTASYLAAPEAGNWRPWRFALAGLACLSLIPNTSLLTWRPWPNQAFFTPDNAQRVLGQNPNVLILPFGGGPSMAWQVDAGMRFTQSGGYTGFWPSSETSSAVLNELFLNIAGPNFGNDLTAYSATHGVDDILIGPGTAPAIANAIAAMNWPENTDHGIVIVHVPPPSSLNYFLAEGDYWPSPEPENWIGRRFHLITHGTPMTLTLTGKWRPMSAPAQVTVTTPFNQVIYPVNQATVEIIHVPANSELTLTAAQTFVPADVLHNGDTRQLSVTVALQKG